MTDMYIDHYRYTSHVSVNVAGTKRLFQKRRPLDLSAA